MERDSLKYRILHDPALEKALRVELCFFFKKEYGVIITDDEYNNFLIDAYLELKKEGKIKASKSSP